MSPGLPLLSFISIPGGPEWLIVLAIGLLFFGRRLPEVGRNIGKTVIEFRKGIKDIEEEVEEESRRDSRKELPAEERRPSIETDERSVAREGTPKEA